MWPNSPFPANLVTFTEKILNGKLYFLCSLPLTYPDLCDNELEVVSPEATEGILEKRDVLKNLTIFTGKHLCQSLFFNKVAGLRLLYRTTPGN